MKVYIVGDSTVCEYDCDFGDLTCRNGYGMRIKEYLVGVETVDLALSGRSSRSFIGEKNYSVLKDSLSAGDYLVIGFGHNDQKHDDRFSYPDKSENVEGSFKYYLYHFYIKSALERGAIPVICTPIARLRDDFDYSGVGGHVTQTDGRFTGGDYPAAIRELAAGKGVTLVDMTKSTVALYKSMPLERVKKLFNADATKPDGVDHTHLNGYGARYMAYIFCKLLTETDCPLKNYVDESRLSPPFVPFGDQ